MVLQSSEGQAALIALLTVGVIVLILGISVAVKSSISTLSSRRSAFSLEAFYLAQSGIEDAYMKLARDNEYVTTSDDATCQASDAENQRTEYRLTIGTGAACVEVKKTGGTHFITARGTKDNNTRTIEVQATLGLGPGDTDPNDALNFGKITITSWKEL